MAEERVQRRLAAILAADVVGYSRLMDADEAGTLARLKDLRRDLFEPVTKRHGGRVFKTTGDGALVEFKSAADAVTCAADIQRALAERRDGVGEESRITLRIGISLGDVIVEGADLYGNGVNVAARMEALAEPGGICISANVHEHVRGEAGLVFDDLGDQQVKNFDRPVRAWRVAPATPAQPRSAEGMAARAERPGIAVLPFANMSGDPEQEYFADGMVEEIITGLSPIRWLTVIARNSTFAYKGTTPDVRKVGRDLAVRYVLEGSVRKAGDRVRITAQLIESETGGHLWANRFDGSMADVFDLQDQITAGVVAAIEPSVRGAEIERAKRKRPDNLDAYDLYLRALPHAYAYTGDGWLQAIELLNRALALEPDFAEAHGLAAWCHFHFFLDDGRQESRKLSLDHARAVLAIPTAEAAPLAYAAMALASFPEHRKTALGMIDRALARNRNSMQAHAFGAVVNAFEGRCETAIELAEEALRLNPYDPSRFNAYGAIGNAKCVLGDFVGAEAALREALQLNPRHFSSLLWLTASLVRQNRQQEASDAASDLLAFYPDFRIAPWAQRVPFGEEAIEMLTAALRTAGLPD